MRYLPAVIMLLCGALTLVAGLADAIVDVMPYAHAIDVIAASVAILTGGNLAMPRHGSAA